jgi:hypothetical protein
MYQAVRVVLTFIGMDLLEDFWTKMVRSVHDDDDERSEQVWNLRDLLGPALLTEMVEEVSEVLRADVGYCFNVEMPVAQRTTE